MAKTIQIYKHNIKTSCFVLAFIESLLKNVIYWSGLEYLLLEPGPRFTKVKTLLSLSLTPMKTSARRENCYSRAW
jgi:hypothetical protein